MSGERINNDVVLTPDEMDVYSKSDVDAKIPLIQAGKISIAPAEVGVVDHVTVNLPVAFADIPIVVATANTLLPDKIDISVYVDRRDRFGIYICKSNNTNAVTVHWIAVGQTVAASGDVPGDDPEIVAGGVILLAIINIGAITSRKGVAA